MMRWVLAAILVLGMWGCTTRSTTTEGDRQVEDQTEKAAIAVQEKIAAAKEAIAERKLDDAVSLLEMGAIAGREAELNMAQLRAVHGPPEKPLPFSPENSKAARESSAKDHASGGWLASALPVLGAVCGVVATVAGMPWLAPLFPALAGKLGKWAATGSQIITAARSKAESQGGSLHVQDLLEIAATKNSEAGIQSFVKKRVDKQEKAAGHKFRIKRTSPPADLAATIPSAS